LRERWFGATGKRVPELAVEGDPLVPLAEALVFDDVSDDAKLREVGLGPLDYESRLKELGFALSPPDEDGSQRLVRFAKEGH